MQVYKPLFCFQSMHLTEEPIFCYFAPMHANVQTRFNLATGNEASYYRLKESYRDVAGHVHSLILINISFEPSLTAVQVQKIAFALTERFKDSGTNPLFDKQPEDLRRDCTMIGVKLGLILKCL